MVCTKETNQKQGAQKNTSDQFLNSLDMTGTGNDIIIVNFRFRNEQNIILINKTETQGTITNLSQMLDASFWVIIKAGSKGRESGPKVGSKYGQSNNNI